MDHLTFLTTSLRSLSCRASSINNETSNLVYPEDPQWHGERSPYCRFCLILNKPEFGCFFAGRHTMESSFQDPLQWFFGSSSDEWISVPHFEFFLSQHLLIISDSYDKTTPKWIVAYRRKGTFDLRGSHQPLHQLIVLGLWTWHWRSPALRTLQRPATQTGSLPHREGHQAPGIGHLPQLWPEIPVVSTIITPLMECTIL